MLSYETEKRTKEEENNSDFGPIGSVCEHRERDRLLTHNGQCLCTSLYDTVVKYFGKMATTGNETMVGRPGLGLAHQHQQLLHPYTLRNTKRTE